MRGFCTELENVLEADFGGVLVGEIGGMELAKIGIQ